MSSPEDLLRKLCFSEDGLLDVPLKMEKIRQNKRPKKGLTGVQRESGTFIRPSLLNHNSA